MLRLGLEELRKWRSALITLEPISNCILAICFPMNPWALRGSSVNPWDLKGSSVIAWALRGSSVSPWALKVIR